ncbi:transcription/translation regulatory transformer protein RfaH [Vibrio gazogenes]|uniref:Transcription antitermination protein RfaH n=1 Tax=Vibrio gazogenes DSM 21264 = NBRC 103151 TaxID=1123492 RepID=A0A1M5DKT8_VIBGA|nr:transcription/translation regulatory transformer protein RfaH [Vibrio gazogenes]USP14612.1 transcription/translation regulatory transformer protein RfaH [Vibrio gazogenes]SHF67524.1 transcriptional antiterminator RfaH [Vibrio gazogenes DSM 21264] [Vibrio gazogenes DSM 21264 = NBRC 103151]SJN58206.1 Transcription antitermination protein RfaH [Vibrio gazogenes]
MKQWYLLYCKRGEQQRAKCHLENQGVECYYPEIKVEKILRGKKQTLLEPLFPSYMFVCFDYENGPSFVSVRSTRGVADFIRFGQHPKEVSAALIDHLKILESNTQSLQQSMPQCGQVIRVKGGQFAGIDAIYQEADGETRSIMLVKMISQTVAMSFDNRDLELS